MVNSKKSRQLPAIVKQSNRQTKNSELDLISDFQKNLEKMSVQPYRSEQESIYNQISSIMGNKSKYPTVQAAVKDMQDRSGLTDYLKKVQSSETSNSKKVAFENDMPDSSVQIFKDLPEVKQTIDNIIESSGGYSSVPSVIQRVKSIYSKEVSDNSRWDSPDLIEYITEKCEEAKGRNQNTSQSANLGGQSIDSEIDPSNKDAFHSLNPVSTGK